MPNTLLPRGASETAIYLDQQSQKAQVHFEQTAAFSKQPAIEELADIWEECKTFNWDGYSADPVQASTLSYAYAFIQALPLGFPLPSIGAEADGHLTLEWYRCSHWLLSISISPDSVLYYAALFGNSDVHGSEPFFGDNIPKSILDLIQRVYRA